MNDPRRIVVAGCWHGRAPWARSVIARLPKLLPDESPRIVVHTGDFGIWPGGEAFVDSINRALCDVDARLWFVDGNHEYHPKLHRLRTSPGCTDPVPVGSAITWLPRGHRWDWHGTSWLALGGAVSVDRAHRTEGVSWWPQEEITDADIARVVAGGHADVMVTHDAPSTVRLPLGPPDPSWSLADLARADRHRERLQQVVDVVMPSVIVHGHYHLAHESVTPMHYGPVEVLGLDREGSGGTGNFGVLDVRDLPTAVIRD